MAAGLVVVAAAVVAWQLWPGSGAQAGGRTNRAPAGAGRAAEGETVPDVRVGALDGSRADPVDRGRNPFRFQAAQPPPSVLPALPARPGSGAAGTAGSDPLLPSAPPPPPPISYKFIGIVAGGDGVGRIAVLSDGKVVVHGREGDIIEGRFRLVKIGEESVQMEYIDGRGRQTIRLSGG